MFLGFCLLIARTGPAQNRPVVDSLLNVVQGDAPGPKKVEAYVSLAREYRNADAAQAVNYCRKAIEIADRIDDEKGKFNALIEIGRAEMRSRDYQASENLFRELVKRAEALDYPEGMASAYYQLGAIFYHQNEYGAALENFFESLQIRQTEGNKKGISHSYNSIGVIYRHQGNLEKSLEYFLKSLKIKEELGDKAGMASTFNNIGMVLAQQSDYNRALEYYFKALDIDKARGAKSEMAYSYNNISYIYLSQGDLENALDYRLRALQLFKDLKDEYGIAHVHGNIGMIYFEKGEYERALEYNGLALKSFEDLDAKAETANTLTQIGSIYLKQEKFATAQQHLRVAMRLARETGKVELLHYVANNLAVAEKELGNYKAAFEAHVLFKQMSDSLVNEEKTRNITRLAAEYEFQQEKDSIQFANAQIKARQEQRLSRQRYITWASAGAFVAILVIALLIYRSYRDKQKTNALLEKKNEEIERQKQELQELDQVKSRFFANISHELRTPLTLISAPVEQALNNESADPAIREELAIVHRNTQKLRALVDDILSLSRLNTSKIEVHRHQVGPHAFLSRIRDNFSSLAEHLHLSLELDLEALPDAPILMDAGKTEKIVNNLLSNALKFTPDGGTVQLTAGLQAERWSVKVKDTGSGIAPEDLPHIFDRYYQSRQPNAPIQGGTGIGLALAKEYALLMNGALSVSSTEGEGSTFTLELPYTPAPPVATPEAAPEIADELEMALPAPPPPGSPMERPRVLIVEDDPDMQQFIRNLFRERYRVSVANNGKQALQRLDEEAVDLIVSDVMMPEMDGFTLLSRLRNDEAAVRSLHHAHCAK